MTYCEDCEYELVQFEIEENMKNCWECELKSNDGEVK